MTIKESLLSLTSYPIPDEALDLIMLERGLSDTATNSTEDDSTSEPQGESAAGSSLADIVKTKAYKLAKADVYTWLSAAPNVSQGGQSYGFNADEKKRFLRWASNLYAENGESDASRTIYGYKGSRL